MHHCRLIVAFVLATAAPCALAGAAGARIPASPPAQDQFGGMVADQTVTAAGQEFYKTFCAFWHDQPLSNMFTLSVREVPSARRGNQILVDYAGRTIFQAALPTNRGGIAPLGEKAAEMSSQHMSNVELARMLLRDPDLGPDEF